jgi:peptide/nickel transport system substrate-binding protein
MQYLTSFLQRGVAAAVLAACLVPVAHAQSAAKTLRFVPEGDLRSLDPVWTTSGVTRTYAYMVYDQLFALDDKFKAQPQMIDKWTVSPDKLKYTFILRDGLRWHDGAAVRPEDCIASIERWMKRDQLGQSLAGVVAEMKPVDGKTFTIQLKSPFPLMIDGFAKLAAGALFVMPERVAKTDASTQISEVIGSGPFKFVKAEWVPGSKAVFERNKDYKPRSEPSNWGAGGKVVNVDRVEWIYIPDPQTATNALRTGSVDWMAKVPQDLVPQLEQSKDIRTAIVDSFGTWVIMRFNHEQPPFNDEKLRQAVLHGINQSDYMVAIAGEDKKYWQTCFSYYTCKTPLSSTTGADALMGERSLDKAKELIKQSSYKGEKIVIMSATDMPLSNASALVTADLFRKLGLNVDLQSMDWGTQQQRRASRAAPSAGGWNVFFTYFSAADMLNPALNIPLSSSGAKAWIGWPSNPKLEALRTEWLTAEPGSQKTLATEIQVEAFKSVPYVPLGQFLIPTAYRRNLQGVVLAPEVFMWSVDKK